MIKKIFKNYAIISLDDISKIDFDQVGETSADTIRTNLLTPPTEFILKWDELPSFIEDGSVVPVGTYSHEEMISILQSEPWQNPLP
jgi:hypothetical protein